MKMRNCEFCGSGCKKRIDSEEAQKVLARSVLSNDESMAKEAAKKLNEEICPYCGAVI